MVGRLDIRSIVHRPLIRGTSDTHCTRFGYILSEQNFRRDAARSLVTLHNAPDICIHIYIPKNAPHAPVSFDIKFKHTEITSIWRRSTPTIAKSVLEHRGKNILRICARMDGQCVYLSVSSYLRCFRSYYERIGRIRVSLIALRDVPGVPICCYALRAREIP